MSAPLSPLSPPLPARVVVSTKLSSAKTNAIMTSLILAPPGQPVFDKETLARLRYEQYHAGGDLLGAGSMGGSPDYSRAGSVLNSPTHGAGGGGGFFRSGINPYAPREGDHLLDEPLTEDLIDDADLIEQVWSFRTPPTPKAVTPKVSKKLSILREASVVEAPQPLVVERDHLISPSRKQQINENLSVTNTPFLKMFKLPSYNNDEQPELMSPPKKKLSGALAKADSKESMQVDVPSDHHEQSIAIMEDGSAADATAEDTFAADSNDLPPLPSVIPLIPLTVQPGDNIPTVDEHVIGSDGNLERAEITRDAKKVSAVADPWFATRQAKKASNLYTALGILSNAPEGIFRKIPVQGENTHEYPPDTFPTTVQAVAKIHSLADATMERERLRKEEENRTLDARKAVAHAQYMKLVLRHVRTRLIQEGKFIEDTQASRNQHQHSHHRSSSTISNSSHSSSPASGPMQSFDGGEEDHVQNDYRAILAIQKRDAWRGEQGAKSREGSASSERKAPNTSNNRRTLSSSMSSPSLLPPIERLDVYKEITGFSRPASSTSGRSGSRGPGSLRSSPQASPKSPNSGIPLPSFSISHAKARMLRGEDPLKDLPFYIDPLDPERPENKHKVYKLNPAIHPEALGANGISLGQKEWPLDSRGPENLWQELTDEEELSAYRKVLWLCEIKALSHIPLDGMLELILCMIERAFDVEVLLRAGEPGDTLFFIKQGEVQLKMERKIVEEMEERRLLEAMTTTGIEATTTSSNSSPYQTYDPAASSSHHHHSNSSLNTSLAPDGFSLQNHPHPTATTHTISTLPLLPTDPDLVMKHVEIAKLGPMGICGEDILISSHRRYTLISLTPVWLYEIKASALLKCFAKEARQNFLVAIAHTQRVRERHALVKSRTRLQYHVQPTMFRHFIDDGLKRNLGRATKKVPAQAAEDGPTLEDLTLGTTAGGGATGVAAGFQQLLSPGRLKGSPAAAVLLSGGGPDALRAVLQDLNNISSGSKHRYVQQSPETIEALVAQAAMSKDRRTIQQHDLMKERERTEQRGGTIGSPTNSSVKFNIAGVKSPKLQPSNSNSAVTSPAAAAAPVSEEKQQSDSPFLSPLKREGSSSNITSPASPTYGVKRAPSLRGPVKDAHVAMGHHRVGSGSPSHMSTPGKHTRSPSFTFGRSPSTTLSLEQRLAVTLAETEALKKAQDEALAGQGPAGDFIRAQMLAATPAGRSTNLAGLFDERQAFLSEHLRAERDKASAEKAKVPSPQQTSAKPEHRRRISNLVTASGMLMYDNPFGPPRTSVSQDVTEPTSNSPPISNATGKSRVTHSPATRPLPAPGVTAPPTGTAAQRKQSHSPQRGNNSPSKHGRSLTQNTSSGGSPAAAASGTFDSPFSMKFSESAVFEKSAINARPGVILFNSTKQHVARHTVAPLRTQNATTLGDAPQEEQTYGDMTSPMARKRNVIAQANARLQRATASTATLEGIPTSPTQGLKQLHARPTPL